jgi:hypothetical protein
LTAYANGYADDVTAWSIEAHLSECTLCRAELAAVLLAAGQSPALAVLAVARGRVMAQLTVDAAASPAPRASRWRRTRMHVVRLTTPASLGAVLIAVLGAVTLAVGTRLSLSIDAAGSTAVLWLFAPVVPLAGVALNASMENDPWREVVLSAPSAGLRLVLWRTLTMLGLAVPLALLAGALLAPTNGYWPVLWLLPCLGLTSTALALGTFVALERAALAAAAAWSAAVVAPVVATVGIDLQDVVTALTAAAPTAADLPLVAGAVAQIGWAVLAGVALVCAAVRHRSYEQLPAAAMRGIT